MKFHFTSYYAAPYITFNVGLMIRNPRDIPRIYLRISIFSWIEWVESFLYWGQNWIFHPDKRQKMKKVFLSYLTGENPLHQKYHFWDLFLFHLSSHCKNEKKKSYNPEHISIKNHWRLCFTSTAQLRRYFIFRNLSKIFLSKLFLSIIYFYD